MSATSSHISCCYLLNNYPIRIGQYFAILSILICDIFIVCCLPSSNIFCLICRTWQLAHKRIAIEAVQRYSNVDLNEKNNILCISRFIRDLTLYNGNINANSITCKDDISEDLSWLNYLERGYQRGLVLVESEVMNLPPALCQAKT